MSHIAKRNKTLAAHHRYKKPWSSKQGGISRICLPSILCPSFAPIFSVRNTPNQRQPLCGMYEKMQ